MLSASALRSSLSASASSEALSTSVLSDALNDIRACPRLTCCLRASRLCMKGEQEAETLRRRQIESSATLFDAHVPSTVQVHPHARTNMHAYTHRGMTLTIAWSVGRGVFYGAVVLWVCTRMSPSHAPLLLVAMPMLQPQYRLHSSSFAPLGR